MIILRRLSRSIDLASGGIGRVVSWFALAMVLIGAFNAIARHLGRGIGVDLSSNLYIELQWYIFSLIFLLGGAFALKEGAHVRVDVLYGRLDRRGKAWVDLVGALVLLIPFCVFVLWVSWPSVLNSWSIGELSPDPGGLPRYPLKTVIIASFLMLLAQALSQLIKTARILREPAERPAEEDPERPGI